MQGSRVGENMRAMVTTTGLGQGTAVSGAYRTRTVFAQRGMTDALAGTTLIL